MLAPTNPNAAPNRSPGGVVSPTRLPVCASHAVNAPTKPVAAPMAADQPTPNGVSKSKPRSPINARTMRTQAAIDTMPPSQP